VEVAEARVPDRGHHDAPIADGPLIFVQKDDIAQKHVTGRVVLKMVGNLAQRVGQVLFVAVQPRADRSVGAGQPPVEGIVHTLVFLAVDSHGVGCGGIVSRAFTSRVDQPSVLIKISFYFGRKFSYLRAAAVLNDVLDLEAVSIASANGVGAW
jgi:hypothetical protein